MYETQYEELLTQMLCECSFFARLLHTEVLRFSMRVNPCISKKSPDHADAAGLWATPRANALGLRGPVWWPLVAGGYFVPTCDMCLVGNEMC